MFIAPTMVQTGAPAERDVSGNGTRDRVKRFAPLERGEIFGGPAFYKHYVPTGRESLARKILLKKPEVKPLYYRDRTEET